MRIHGVFTVSCLKFTVWFYENEISKSGRSLESPLSIRKPDCQHPLPVIAFAIVQLVFIGFVS